MTDSQATVTATMLRAPMHPSHGIYEIYKRFADAFALHLEQQEQILLELQHLNKPAGK